MVDQKMKLKIIITAIFIGLISNIYSADKYASISPALYHYLEYKLLKKYDDKVFILTQPYKLSVVKRILDIKKNRGNNLSTLYGVDTDSTYLFKMRIAPGYNFISDGKQDISDNNFYFNGETVLALNNFLFVNNARIDRFVQYDPFFHGDAGESGMGYFDEAYGVYGDDDSFEFFGGRIARNWGALNEFGLILSNNPYAYDHFGFSTEFKQIKYSYYFTRLNNMMGIDSQGSVMPQDTLINVKRFWSIQRLDYKFSKDLQFGFTEAVVYGGPNQNFSASYLSPFNVYYVSQRNEGVQMSFYIDINMYYKPVDNFAMYIDFFMDDLTINNEEGVDDRADHPDRLGFMGKLSFSDLFSMDKTLISLTYVKIWNDSYTTYRDFENYIYYEKSMGYPSNAHEAVKLDISSFNYAEKGFIPILKFEWSRQGDRTVLNLYDGEKDNFPVGPVEYKFSTELDLTFFKWNFELNLNTKYDMYSMDSGEVFSDEKDLVFKLLVKYNYIADFLRP